VNCLFKIIVFAAAAVVLHGCCRTVKCSAVMLNMNLVGFQPSEMNSIVIRKYVANDNFQVQKDMMTIFNLSALNPYKSGDTTFLSLAGNGIMHFQLSTGFDYMIQLPGANRSYRISDIIESPREIQHCKDEDADFCENEIVSYKVEGITQTQHNFYLRK
jgi:hypothetical protein